MTHSRRLAWLPFEPTELSSPPTSLRYELFIPEEGAVIPESVSDVEFYVPPCRFARSDCEVIARMSSLKVVQTMTAGVDHIRPFLPEGVVLCNGRGIHDASTARARPRARDRSVLVQDIPDWCLTTCRNDVSGDPGSHRAAR